MGHSSFTLLMTLFTKFCCALSTSGYQILSSVGNSSEIKSILSPLLSGGKKTYPQPYHPLSLLVNRDFHYTLVVAVETEILWKEKCHLTAQLHWNQSPTYMYHAGSAQDGSRDSLQTIFLCEFISVLNMPKFGSRPGVELRTGAISFSASDCSSNQLYFWHLPQYSRSSNI